MSDTEQLFALAAVWTIVSIVIARFVPNWGGRIALVVVLVGVPFWELPYGYFNLRKLCDEHGGLRLFEALDPQDSVCASYPFDSSASQLLASGFKLVESRDKDGKVKVLTNNLSGQQSPDKASSITSKYCITQAFVQGLPWRIQRNEYLIVAEKNKRLVARHSDFVWYGMWWQQGAAPVLGRGGECRFRDPVRGIANTLVRGAK